MVDTLELSEVSQSTIKMEKGYYTIIKTREKGTIMVAIHNKNGKGLLR